MFRKTFLFVVVCFIISSTVFSQVSIKDSVISTSLVYATYSYQFPGGDLSRLFGSNSSIGGGFLFKTKKNWIFGVEGNYLFGGTVKNQDSILKNISTKDGFVIDVHGYIADILFSERGYSFFGKFGKLFPVLSPNPNSGITVLAGAGYLEDKIRIHNPGNTAPQVYGDYRKGYDRLNSGVALTGSVGYLYMSNTRLLNLYVGFEFTQTWTTFRRDRNFDTGMKDNSKLSSQFYGIKLKWIIPLYKRTPRDTTYTSRNPVNISLIYTLFIHLYILTIRIAAIFNSKARKWISGRVDLFLQIEEAFRKDGKRNKIAWFHCASLGEFEQGRPVIEAFRKKFPDHRVLLTFFSPSGYEIRRKFDQADWVFYLPPDTKANVKRFLDLVKPDQVFFIKYEYWFNYLDELAARNIPVYIVSAVFRKGQYFFSWYGGWFRKRLKKITWFFLQDNESERLLKSIGIERGTVSGDTRFDRVFAIARQQREFSLVQQFCKDSKVVVAGSTWPEDEQLLIPLIYKENKTRFIIAPHEVGAARIDTLVSRITRKVVRYSEAQGKDLRAYDVLLIDTIGILAHLYKYATAAYVGGGFGKGIHNILEAAAFGAPIIFGPNFSKFREARELSELGGATSIRNSLELETVFKSLMNNPEMLKEKSKICSDYVARKKGATQKILEKL